MAGARQWKRDKSIDTGTRLRDKILDTETTVKDKVLETGAEGVGVASRFGVGAVGRARSMMGKVSGEITEQGAACGCGEVKEKSLD